MTASFSSLSPAIGSEVRGVDLSQPLDDRVRAELRRCFDERHLLVFRDQDLSYEAQRRLVEVFGAVADEHLDGSYVAYVSNRRADGIVPEGRLLWHSDFTFTPWPVETICLYAIEIVGDVSTTRFASTERAYGALTDETKARIDGMEALHLADFSPGASLFDATQTDVLPDDVGAVPRHRQPIVRPHPRTGRPLLFVNEWFTVSIPGLAPDASQVLRQELLDELYNPAYVYEHRWSERDLVIWDNLVCQHSRDAPVADAETGPGVRTLRRLIISDGYPQMIETIPSLKASMIERRRAAVTSSGQGPS